jgi:2-methylcitrate dehydratase PrpD
MFGTMSKPLHSGKAAANGIFAARLAAGGITSAADVLATEQGFGAALTDGFDPAALRLPFRTEWHTLTIVVKAHASCGFTHSVVEAMLRLREKVAVGAVRRIRLLVHPEVLSAADIREPATPLEAKFSVRLVAALAFVRGAVRVEDFTSGIVRDRALADLASRVEVVADETGVLARLASVCTVETGEGDELSVEYDAGRRLWDRSPDEQAERVRAKFTGLAGPRLGSAKAGAVVEMVAALEMMADVRQLVRTVAERVG